MHADRAERLLALCRSSHPAAYHAVVAGYQELIEGLGQGGQCLDRGTHEAWRLLGSRESLETHLRAAEAAERCGMPAESMSLLRRGLSRLLHRLGSARTA